MTAAPLKECLSHSQTEAELSRAGQRELRLREEGYIAGVLAAVVEETRELMRKNLATTGYFDPLSSGARADDSFNW